MTTIKALLWPVEDAEQAPMRPSLRVGSLDRFDRWTLGLIGFVFLVLLANLSHLKPSMSDTWYHLGVAKRVVVEGGIPGWDWWNYAPIGRPHLYPPLLHLIIAGLARVTGSVILAGQLCAATFLPAALLSTWYCARRILNSRMALLAVLVVMTDMFHFVVMRAYIAGCLINILMPVLIVAFLSRRAWWSILLLTLMYYSHLGFPHCVALGLLLFGFKYRSYLRPALKVVSISLLFFTPWLSHVLGHLDWLGVLGEGGMPGGLLDKVLSLQTFNLVLLGMGFWGIARAPRSAPARMLPIYLLMGFLPILFSYGGRYMMHTIPLWAILGGSVLGPLLPTAPRTRRVLGVMALTLLPLPSIGFMGGAKPAPFTASHMLIMLSASGMHSPGDQEKCEDYLDDCDALAGWLKTTTAPDEIIYVNKVWIADMISLLTDRPTDFGAWWECSKESAKLYNRALRDWAPKAKFVYVRPEADSGSVLWDTSPMPGVDEQFDLGRFRIGVRNPRRLRPGAGRVSGWSALSSAGAAGRVKESPAGIHWRFDPDDGKLALISAPITGADLAGIRFRISASAMTGDLVFGARGRYGQDYRWTLSVPYANTTSKVCIPFRWMVTDGGKSWSGDRISEVYFAHPPRPAKKRPKPGDKEREEGLVTITGIELQAERQLDGS